MPKSAMTMSDDGSLVRKRMFSGLSSVACYTQIAGEWRRDVLEIPVSDVVIVQVLHARQDRTGRKELIVSRMLDETGAYLSTWPKNVRTYRSTATASRSEKCPRWLMRSKSSPPTASSNPR
jgi:hypothetical protein